MKTHSGLVAHVITPPKLFVRPVALHAAQCVVGILSMLCHVSVFDSVVARSLVLPGLPVSRLVNGCFGFFQLLCSSNPFFQIRVVFMFEPLNSRKAGMVIFICFLVFSVACCCGVCPEVKLF